MRMVLAVGLGVLLAIPAFAEWELIQRTDEMTDATITVLSTTTDDGDSLNVACGGKKGKDLVVFVLAKSFTPRVVHRSQMRRGLWWTVPSLLRFDDKKPDKSGFDVDPGKPERLEFETPLMSRNVSSWVRKIEKASRLRVSVEAVDGPARVMNFDLSGFDGSKLSACYKSKK